MAKLSNQEKAILNAKLEDINKQIESIRKMNLKVPDVLVNSRNKIESQLNKNKFNAKKQQWDGIDFDSTFEMEYAKLLRKCDIPFEHHRVFQLAPPFELKYPSDMSEYNQKIRAITYEPDFVIEDCIIIDVKGNEATQTRTFEDKWKLLKGMYRERYHYLIISNNQEAGLSISQIRRILGSKNK